MVGQKDITNFYLRRNSGKIQKLGLAEFYHWLYHRKKFLVQMTQVFLR